MAKYALRIKARGMRRAGQSIKSIASKLEVSKGSVSLWCRDIRLTPKQIEQLEDYRDRKSLIGRMKGTETNRRKKERMISEGKTNGLKEVGGISRRDLFIAGLSLYAGEGFKYSTRVGLANADPYIVLFAMKWFRKICGVSDERFYFVIGINQCHRYRIKEVIAYWSGLLHVPASKFRISYKKVASSKVYDNPEIHFGTLTVIVSKACELQYRIFGWMDALFGKP
jgi:hypothetical protein